MPSDRLSPFSYVLLVLVGQGGAGPHDLRRNAEQGRVYWEAAPSQWYAEPKRLAELGYLKAEKQPGRTRERTHYTLTQTGRKALEKWARTPVGLPRMQHENIVRLMAADLVGAEAVLAGLPALRDEVETELEHVAEAREAWTDLPRRSPYLEVNDRYAERLLRLQLEWLDDAEKALRAERA